MALNPWHLACVACGARHGGLEVRYRCDCGGTLDVVHERGSDGKNPLGISDFDARRASRDPLDRSGVWRFRELIAPFPAGVVATRREGDTGLYDSDPVAEFVGARIQLKHEGENPTGSFKDRGMTVGVSAARLLGMTRVACASTGNTSAAMAAYAAAAGLPALVFIPDGQISYGKLSQALAYGARTVQIEGDFDAAMRLVEAVCAERGLYLLNSVNPWRIEGQKAIGFELLQDRGWCVPDWIVLPGGNLGNASALAKGMVELLGLGLIDRLPKIAIVQAEGANPLYRAWTSGGPIAPVNADTLATAIRIGDPVSGAKALRGLAKCGGTVTQVSDAEIFEAKAVVDAAGIGAEPASCATVAGARRLVAEGVIAAEADICGVLTGHILKDPDSIVKYHTGTLPGIESTRANRPVRCAADLKSVLRVLDGG